MSDLEQMIRARTRPAAPELIVNEHGGLRCLACGHRCLIHDGGTGICRVRSNQSGTLRVPWGYAAVVQCEPIEKKPFYHVHPGSNALTFGMLGCDMHCGYCQNWITSQALRDPMSVASVHDFSPEQLAEMAVAAGARTVISSYNEPLITAEWSADVFSEARQRGLLCGYVSNGNATPEVLRYLAPPLLNFYKVDLKSFREANYRRLGGVLSRVLSAIEQIHDLGIWLEVVTLIIPGFNDSDAELQGIARFLAGISADIPWHVTPFTPDYKMDQSAGYAARTDAATLLRAYEFGREAGLQFVYAGNRPGEVGGAEHTYCPQCGQVAIERLGYRVRKNVMLGSTCSNCHQRLPGIWI